jgi:HEAT repeat protein
MSLGTSSSFTFALALGLLWSTLGGAATTKPGPRKDPMLTELESESADVRRAAVEKIVGSQRETSQKVADLLTKYLAAPGREGTAKDLILLLGKLRAVDHVPLLVRALTFKVFYRNTKRPQTIEDLYPAVQALADIGGPAIDPVLARMQHEDGEEVQRTGAAVLRAILGASRAKLILESAIQSTRSRETKARLTQAVKLLKELP